MEYQTEQSPSVFYVNSADKRRRKRCGACPPCQVTQNCEQCKNCVNRKILKQTCIYRKCIHLNKGKNGSDYPDENGVAFPIQQQTQVSQPTLQMFQAFPSHLIHPPQQPAPVFQPQVIPMSIPTQTFLPAPVATPVTTSSTINGGQPSPAGGAATTELGTLQNVQGFPMTTMMNGKTQPPANPPGFVGLLPAGHVPIVSNGQTYLVPAPFAYTPIMSLNGQLVPPQHARDRLLSETSAPGVNGKHLSAFTPARPTGGNSFLNDLLDESNFDTMAKKYSVFSGVPPPSSLPPPKSNSADSGAPPPSSDKANDSMESSDSCASSESDASSTAAVAVTSQLPATQLASPPEKRPKSGEYLQKCAQNLDLQLFSPSIVGEVPNPVSIK